MAALSSIRPGNSKTSSNKPRDRDNVALAFLVTVADGEEEPLAVAETRTFRMPTLLRVKDRPTGVR